jgi:hypothetical protein
MLVHQVCTPDYISECRTPFRRKEECRELRERRRGRREKRERGREGESAIDDQKDEEQLG